MHRQAVQVAQRVRLGEPADEVERYAGTGTAEHLDAGEGGPRGARLVAGLEQRRVGRHHALRRVAAVPGPVDLVPDLHRLDQARVSAGVTLDDGEDVAHERL